MAEGNRPSTTGEAMPTRHRALSQRWRTQYEGSFVHEVATGLGDVDFGDRIMIFGGSLLLSVLPLIIVLSAYASHRIDVEIATHLGLSADGVRVVEGLFTPSHTSFNLSVLAGLVLSFAGMVGLARSVEVTYERAFHQSALSQLQSWLRCTFWAVAVAAVVLGDAAVGRTLRDGPGGAPIMAAVEMVGFALFFWWSLHFLLGGREPWRRLRPAAIATGIMWLGLSIFAAFYFSSTIVADSKTYGTIGAAFTLAWWFVAMGAVLTLGAVVGAVWGRRRRTAVGAGPAGRRLSGEAQGSA